MIFKSFFLIQPVFLNSPYKDKTFFLFQSWNFVQKPIYFVTDQRMGFDRRLSKHCYLPFPFGESGK